QKALGDSNANGSGDNLTQGQANLVVRGLGLYGRGDDPMQLVVGLKDPAEAARILRREEARRIVEIRQTVVATVNNVPVRVDHLVDGGPLLGADGSPAVPQARLVRRGVVVSHLTRQGKIGLSRPRRDAHGQQVVNADGSRAWDDEDEQIQGIVL